MVMNCHSLLLQENMVFLSDVASEGVTSAFKAAPLGQGRTNVSECQQCPLSDECCC